MPEQPDTITVTGTASAEVAADRAEILISVTGSTSFGAHQATAKAREVTALTADLRAAGVPSDRVELLGITTQSGGGRLARASSATYRLRVRIEATDQVPAVLDVVAAQRSAGIDGLTWRYPESAGRTEALREAVASARATAEVAAQALGVSLLQVHAFTERTMDEGAAPVPRMLASAAAESAPSLDIDVLHRKTIRVQVEVTYRIG